MSQAKTRNTTTIVTESSGNDPAAMTMMPFDLQIIQDHRQIQNLYERYKSALDTVEKRAVLNSLIRDIALHSVAEEINVYPLYERMLNQGPQLAEKSRMEHQKVKELLYRIDHMRVDDPILDSALAVMMKTFTEHAQEEEQIHLPSLRHTLSDAESLKLGEDFKSTKWMAPTHPHPSAPDKGGMMESLAGFMAKPIDVLKDATRTFAQ